jgi:pimeloyl-ACP methyl ester carboxylesterase
LERPVLAGHSMGGAVVLDYALSYPGEVAGLVLCSTSAWFPVDPSLLELLEQGLAAFHRELARIAFGPTVASAQAEAAVRDLVAAPAAVTLADFRACADFDVRSSLGSVRAPALVLCGEADRLTPPALAEDLACGLPRSRLVLLGEAGHLLPWEVPARVVREVGGFLAGA